MLTLASPDSSGDSASRKRPPLRSTSPEFEIDVTNSDQDNDDNDDNDDSDSAHSVELLGE